jgi:hypothetical protein
MRLRERKDRMRVKRLIGTHRGCCRPAGCRRRHRDARSAAKRIPESLELHVYPVPSSGIQVDATDVPGRRTRGRARPQSAYVPQAVAYSLQDPRRHMTPDEFRHKMTGGRDRGPLVLDLLACSLPIRSQANLRRDKTMLAPTCHIKSHEGILHHLCWIRTYSYAHLASSCLFVTATTYVCICVCTYLDCLEVIAYGPGAVEPPLKHLPCPLERTADTDTHQDKFSM